MFISIEEIAHVTKIKKQYVVALQILSVLSIFVASSFPAYFYSLPILYFLIFTLLGIRENDAEKSFFNSATAIFFSIWIIFSLCHFVLLGHLNNNLDESKSLLILLGFAVPLSDIFAFVIGKLLGKFNLTKTKIASNLSPNKAYSGVLGNIIGAGLGIGIMYFAIKTYMPWYLWVILAIIIGVMGVIGDITESMFKRYYHTKDSSHLIPGHGGILDRIDSALRVIIVLYYFLLFFI
jgi:phosphatidate cytidylyltransferase